jgi:outer membrane protein assembly factor BamB
MKPTRVLVFAFAVMAVAGAAPAQGGGNWPHWRGPDVNGVARGDGPARWSDTENIRWVADIPGRGHSTPAIWGDRIFLTTAVPTGKAPESAPAAQAAPPQGPPPQGRGFGDASQIVEHRFDVLCLDRKTGRTLWQKTARVATPHEGYHRQYGSFASNSPVTDGRHVWASFGSRGVYCYTVEGKPVWERDLGVKMQMRMAFGEGSAPLLVDNALILLYDHQGGSFVVALDKRDGREIWRKARDEESSWSHPFLVEHGGRKQVVITATNRVRSYDPGTGDIVWECAGLGLNTIPNPVLDGEILIVMSGYRNPNLLAIRLGRTGDLTGTDSIVWTNNRGNSYTPSPVLQDGRFYMLTDNGQLSCLNAKTGEAYYRQTRLPKPYNFKASPVAAGGKLYLASEDGDVILVKMGEVFEVIGTNTLTDQSFIASPVIMDGTLYLRSRTRLYAISEAGAGAGR